MVEAAPEMLRDIWETGSGRSAELRAKLAEQGLTALTLLIAESDPKAKDLMVRLTMNLIAEAAPTPHDQDPAR